MNIKSGDKSKRWDAVYKSGEYDGWDGPFDTHSKRPHRIERRNANQADKARRDAYNRKLGDSYDY